ncbi:MAG: ArgE/DapE family deacylase [Rubrobacter sp.]|nr:ArgE/DapE family deacylase [Rubrobacter sp.]
MNYNENEEGDGVDPTHHTSDRERIFEAVDSLADEMVGFLAAIIRIPTINPPGENYEEFVEYFDRHLSNLGYETEVLHVPKDRLDELAPHAEGRPRPNLVARLGDASSGPTIHLNGHYDVVPAGSDWKRDPFGGEVVDGKMYGRGASDMKSGLACQVYAVEALRRAGLDLRGSIVQSAVADEETVGNVNAGMGYLVEKGVVAKENTAALIITEPFGPDGVGIGHKGAIWGEITIFGEKAHGSSPLLGTNAIELAARFLAHISDDLQPRLAKRTTDILVTPEESVSSTLSFDTISGGVATNIVPDRCVMTFNRRLIPGEDLDEARAELLSYLEGMKEEDARFRYEYRETYATDATLVPSDEPLVVAAKEAVKTLGMEPKELISAGSDDQRFAVHGAGITNSIIYGPGHTRFAHIADEYISIDDLVTGAKVLALIVHGCLNHSKEAK